MPANKLQVFLAALIWLYAGLAGAAAVPSWSLKTPAGDTVNFPADAQGHPTVLMFWPSWCPFSRALQPYVQDIWQDYRAAGVKVWTINIKEDRDPVAVLRERGLSFPLLINGDAVAKDYGLRYTPWLVVVDGRGDIVYTRPPKPPTPIHTAKEVRAKLNQLLGDKAVPLPESYPAPYDLHLKDPATLNRQLEPVPLDAAAANAWVKDFLQRLKPSDDVAGLASLGPVVDGKTAIRIAKDFWSQQFGKDETRAQAPYRAYRQNRQWVVLGDGLNKQLGRGFVLVLDADSGRIVHFARRAEAP